QESHLMVKMEQTMTLGPQGELAVTITFKDYKEVDGIKLPMTSEVKNPAFTGVLTLSSVKHNVDLDDALFASPQKDKKEE
ncbi:outer membrane lipoprotein-sorting protein, partial [bacterium]|nr:outer membrane lipoprotein-sorting protein [bacterium]